MYVPLVDLKRVNGPLRQRFHEALDTVMDSDQWVLGDAVRTFETAFAHYLGVGHVLGVGSGADALELIVRGYGLKDDDEVIIPGNSFVASATAVALAGAKPVFCDVNQEAVLDVESVARVATAKTRMVMPVHLYGHCVAMEPLTAWAREHRVLVVEDAAQAHGASYRGRPAGSLGDAAAFSFYPTKNLGALGDGGAVATNDAVLAERITKLRNYGSNKKYHHDIVGRNARLDTLQAAILSVKLESLPRAVQSRRLAAQRFIAGVRGLPLSVAGSAAADEHAFHLLVVLLERAEDRAPLMAHLHGLGVQSGIHYPVAIHQQPAFAELATASLPNVERLAGSIVSLPVFAGITTAEVDHVVASVRSFWPQHGG